MCHSEWDGIRTNMRVNDKASVFGCYEETDSKSEVGGKEEPLSWLASLHHLNVLKGFYFTNRNRCHENMVQFIFVLQHNCSYFWLQMNERTNKKYLFYV